MRHVRPPLRLEMPVVAPCAALAAVAFGFPHAARWKYLAANYELFASKFLTPIA